MKAIIKSLNFFILIATIFFLTGIILLIFAFSGIAIAIPFFTKILFILSLLAFILAAIFYSLRNKVKVKPLETK